MSDGGVSRRGVMAMLAAAASCAGAGVVPQGLRQMACRRRLLFGSAMASSDLQNHNYAELAARECAVLTPTWEMKWRPLQPRPGSFDFAPVDRIVAFARAHGMVLRGHTLVWHVEMPAWLTEALSPATWEELMAAHLTAVMGRYGPVVSSWDVVNEAVEPNDGRSDGLRDSPWLRAAGPGYLAAAFKTAGRLLPNARLVYNDYGCEHEADWTQQRRVAVLKLLEGLKKADAPVHGLGLQSHLRVGDDFDPAAFGRFLDEVRQLGVVPLVTELDVRADRIASVAEKDRRTAELAKAYLDVVLPAGCDTLVCWGLSDDKNWRARDEPDDRPLPFDHKLARKPLYHAIEAAIARSAT